MKSRRYKMKKIRKIKAYVSNKFKDLEPKQIRAIQRLTVKGYKKLSWKEKTVVI